MYLEGIITIDPADLTAIAKVKPTKGFAKIAHALTGGLVTSKEERELFCAISILQQINMVLRSVGVDNVVSITKDDVVVYEDLHGKEGDFKEALDGFLATARSGSPNVFKTLRMVLEHHRGEMSYLIDIGICRNHPVGEHPIRITINGFSQKLNAGQGEERVQSLMQSVFSSQDRYDAFIQLHKSAVQEFMEEIKAAFQKNMSIDKVTMTNRVKIVRPNERIAKREQVPMRSGSQRHDNSYYNDPVYEGYHGYNDAFFYAWLWSDLCHDNNIHCHDCAIVDEVGADVIAVGAEGFDAGANDTLNVDAPFAPPETGCDVIHSGHAYDAQIEAAAEPSFDASGDAGDSGGGWFGSMMGDSFDSGDSSCSGSSCGSSCGGCGGD